MLGKILDNQGLYIGKPEQSNGVIVLKDLESNKNANTLKVGTLGIGRATHINSNNRSNQLP